MRVGRPEQSSACFHAWLYPLGFAPFYLGKRRLGCCGVNRRRVLAFGYTTTVRDMSTLPPRHVKRNEYAAPIRSTHVCLDSRHFLLGKQRTVVSPGNKCERSAHHSSCAYTLRPCTITSPPPHMFSRMSVRVSRRFLWENTARYCLPTGK